MDKTTYEHLKHLINHPDNAMVPTFVLLGYILQTFKADSIDYKQTLELIGDLHWLRR